MDEHTANKLLDQLANKEITEFMVEKDDFLEFQKYLVKRPDFKHIRGIAQRGGHVIYQFMDEARS